MLSPKPIELRLSPTSVVMERAGTRIESPTTVTFTRMGTKLFPTLSGQDGPIGTDTFRIALFDPASSQPGVNKSDCLAALLFRMADPLVRSQLLAVKPPFVVKGTATLGPILAGYQESVIRTALEPIAMSITFERA